MSVEPLLRFAHGAPAPPAEHPTLCAAFHDTVARQPERVALRTSGDRIRLTWRQYAERVRRTAAGLAACGVARGDTVAVVLDQRPELACVDAAAMQLGATTVAPYLAAPPDTFAHMLRAADARIAITEAALADRVAAAQRELPRLERLVYVDNGPAGSLNLDELEAAGDQRFNLDAAAGGVAAGDVAAVVYTSGTAGPPTAVELSHELILRFLAAFDAVAGHDPARYVSFLPLAHATERVCGHYRAMLRGSCVTFCPDAAELAPTLADARPNFLLAPPLLWRTLAEPIHAQLAAQPDGAAALAAARARLRASAAEPVSLAHHQRRIIGRQRARRGLDRLGLALSAGAPCPRELLETLHALGLPIRNAYGMTELGFLTISEPLFADATSAGQPLPGVEIRLADDGEILARTAWGAGRQRNPAGATAVAVDADGWVRTGDIGSLDKAGRLHVSDRKKDLIISLAGHNMSPTNIEARLEAASPLIARACCIGDGRPHNVALLILDPKTANTLARRQRPHTDLAGLATEPAILDAVAAAVARANQQLSDREQIVNHAVLTTAWTPGGDELTPTGKLRRRAIAAKYTPQIESLYRPQTRP